MRYHLSLNYSLLKALLTIGIKYLTQIFNSPLLTGYFPAQWKVAQIILLLKPGKPPNELVFENILLRRLLPLLENNSLIPNHQFGFRKRHSTIEQTHRIV
jgi:hypothetical protein